jgi:hypothetical protein
MLSFSGLIVGWTETNWKCADVICLHSATGECSRWSFIFRQSSLAQTSGVHGKDLCFRRDESNIHCFVWRHTLLTGNYVKALMVTLVRQFSFSCSHEIEPFQSFVIRPRIKGQGPSSLPLLVRKVAL